MGLSIPGAPRGHCKRQQANTGTRKFDDGEEGSIFSFDEDNNRRDGGEDQDHEEAIGGTTEQGERAARAITETRFNTVDRHQYGCKCGTSEALAAFPAKYTRIWGVLKPNEDSMVNISQYQTWCTLNICTKLGPVNLEKWLYHFDLLPEMELVVFFRKFWASEYGIFLVWLLDVNFFLLMWFCNFIQS